ncbi:suppressor APC domain-containing protein 1-like [Brienomyrus brachyistius]|uniref:suppressor APC domain-containing protein 1-like n=1 Tax=Brienomyrus brachyistius TaxID=42636 RepID=UPI0020B3266A|nr:suppressor APC domain-containing protein 1-like [Brienomyrus brachyistius]
MLVPMVTRWLGSRGLDARGLSDQPGPAWTTSLAAYSTVFIPLSSSLYSDKALKFFLWLKQMKELELEKDSLLAGLDMLEQAKNWYQDQICNIIGRQRQMGKSSQYRDTFLKPSQSQLNVLLPKMQEVNSRLSDLMSCYRMASVPHPTFHHEPTCQSEAPPHVANVFRRSPVKPVRQRMTALEREV